MFRELYSSLGRAQLMKYVTNTRNARMNSPCFGMKKHAVGPFKVCRSHEDFAFFRIHGFEPSSNLWVFFLLKLKHHLIRLWVRIQDFPLKKQVVAKTVKDVRSSTRIDRHDFSKWMYQRISISKMEYPMVLLVEEILHHLGCITPCKQWDIYYISWCRISSINRMMNAIFFVDLLCGVHAFNVFMHS